MKLSERGELWLFGVLYAIFSSTLLVANKWALSWIGAPNFLMALQFVATAILVYVVGTVSAKPLKQHWHPFVSRQTAIWFTVCVLLQFITIRANMMSLQLLGVDRVILLRIFAMFPIAIGDWLFNNRHLPSVNSWLCFACLGSAVFFVFGNTRSSLAASSVLWGIAYFAFITSDQVLLKRFTKAVEIEDSDRTFWMNLLGVPVAVVDSFASGERAVLVTATAGATWTSNVTIAIVASCVLGAGISYTAWGLRRRASAVTFSLIAVVCKIGSMALNYLFLDHVGIVDMAIITMGIASSYFYEQAPVRSDRRAEAGSGGSARVSRWLLVLLLLISITGVTQHTSRVDTHEHKPSAPPSAVQNTTQPQAVLEHAPVKITPRALEIEQERLAAALEYEQSKWASRNNQLYSSFRCVGDSRAVSVAPWKFRSCHFKNVCYDGNAAGTLTYFASPDDDATEADMSSGTMVPYETDARVNIDEYRVAINRNASVPVNTETVWAHAHHSTRTVLVPANYFIPGVWTHLVMDNIYPIYRVLELFGLEHATVDPVWLSDPCRTGYRDGCQFSDARFNPQWISLLTHGRHNLTRFQDTHSPAAVSNSTRKYVCFRNVATGLSLFSDHAFGDSGHGRNLNKPDWPVWGTGSHLWRFRLRTMYGAGIPDPDALNGHTRTGNASVAVADVVFLRKGSKTWSPNALDVAPAVNALKFALQRRNVTNVVIDDQVYMERYTLREQMELMARAKVVVTQVGSTAYGAFWLGKGASLVLLERGELLDYYFWTNLPYIHTKYLKWTPENLTPLVSAVLAGLDRFGALSVPATRAL